MYQVFDWELFGLPPPLPPLAPLAPLAPPAEDDDPGDCIDDEALGFLGLGFEWHEGDMGGDQMGGNGEDPGGGGGGGGWDWWGAAAAAAGTEEGELGGQLMGMDDDDYVDYNCFSSGLTSPSLDSEFFFRPTQSNPSEFFTCSAVAGSELASFCHHPPQFQWNSPPGIRSTVSDRRPDSPYFHLDSGFALPGCGYRGGHGLRREFDDSEAEESVKAIARYLASFEVQTPDSYSDSQKVNGATSLRKTVSTRRPNGDQVKSTARATSGGSLGIFHRGYDVGGRGLESTLVNPSDVLPDRVDRFIDHQYASLPSRGPPSTMRRCQGGSVLEALLTSNEPIDPNRGSGSALGLDAADEDQVGFGCCRGNADAVDKKTSSPAPQVMMLKRLLMG